MATLDLRDAVKPTDGRQESTHAVDVGTTYTLIYWPPRRLFRSASVRGNNGALIWATGATEGGTPNANDPHVPSGVDDQVLLLAPVDTTLAAPVSTGLASTSGTVNAVVILRWR